MLVDDRVSGPVMPFNQASRMADLSSAMRKVPGVSHPRPGLLSTGGVTTPT